MILFMIVKINNNYNNNRFLCEMSDWIGIQSFTRDLDCNLELRTGRGSCSQAVAFLALAVCILYIQCIHRFWFWSAFKFIVSQRHSSYLRQGLPMRALTERGVPSSRARATLARARASAGSPSASWRHSPRRVPQQQLSGSLARTGRAGSRQWC